jgi:hypothetical protein
VSQRVSSPAGAPASGRTKAAINEPGTRAAIIGAGARPSNVGRSLQAHCGIIHMAEA